MRILYVLFCLVCGAVLSDARDTVYMDQWCNETYILGSDPDIRIKLTSSFYYASNMDCTFTLAGQYRTDNKLMVNFQDVSICCGGNKTCHNDWLRIHDGLSTQAPTIGKSQYCGIDTPYRVYTTSGPALTFHFKSDASQEETGFDVILTHYRTGWCDYRETECDNGRCIDNSLRCNGGNPCGWCDYRETECDNGRCIDSSLACNGDNPCGDYSDCYAGDYDGGSSEVDFTGVIIAASVGGTLGFIVLLATIIVICCVVCRRGNTTPRRQGHVIMTTSAVTTVGSPQQQVYGHLPPQYQVHISTSPVTSYPAQNATSYPLQPQTTSETPQTTSI